ncbi:radical SAM family heme chaperone HemW [Feifania hominis]|uniref:Heme chaperone HemW n=1 Tax=Feifania hominis TaxID=2763660 RepID=A0A926DDV8_9FIRM|nr:radical SAM family heme chaperone HemW [Feifania hominis]MBC8536293.1 radical SAM family heme chaperone HemW [Feifania hominis]
MSRPARAPRADRPLGLYVHIPFCERKCSYCDFYSKEAPKSKIDEYLNALYLQMEAYSLQTSACVVGTLYVGGGTPSLLTPKQIGELFARVKKNFRLARDCEITVEVNPASAMKKTLRALRRAGVNRLSIGLQSTHDEELAALGRLHTWEQFLETYTLARKLRFQNVSVDLMYGIPQQTPESFAETLRRVIELGPEHVSAYGLQIEEGTPFFERRASLALPDEESEVAMYELAVRLLGEAGYRHYEISNYAREGFESRHNLRYWNCDDYLGLGTAAASYFCGKRFRFAADMERYIAASKNNFEGIVEDYFEIPLRENIGEYVMLRLRLADGVDKAAFFRLFRRQFDELFGQKLQPYLARSLAVDDGACVRLTDEGMYVSNHILSDLIDFS